MKHLLLTTIATVLLVGCGEAQQSVPPESKPAEPVVESSKPELPTAKAPDISLFEAADRCNIEAVKQHLAAGTDVNTKDKYGFTPLHFADTREIAKLLISKGADVSAKGDDGGTPLDVAIQLKQTDIADLLRKHGGKTSEELKAEGI